MSEPATVRGARREDLPAIMRLYAQLHRGDPELGHARIDEVFEQIIATPGLDVLVLELGDRVVATAYLNVIANLTRAAAPYAVIENVVVDEAQRGTGLGQQLMAATLQAAWSAGCYKAMLLTGSREPATHGFYRACGFDANAKTAYLARPM